jgi:hypothetical protein
MEKGEDLSMIAQLLMGMKDSIDKLEEAYNRRDSENLAKIKKEILVFQKKINGAL